MKYIAFLRGINVGGHHKVPMAQLKEEFIALGFSNPMTLLNSGNIIFESEEKETAKLESILEERLGARFGFAIPVIIRTSEILKMLIGENPFQGIAMHKDLRQYITFLKENPTAENILPWASEDESFKILSMRDGCVLSVLNVSISKTPKAMKALEGFYGKNVTTRNWKTILKIQDKISG